MDNTNKPADTNSTSSTPPPIAGAPLTTPAMPTDTSTPVTPTVDTTTPAPATSTTPQTPASTTSIADLGASLNSAPVIEAPKTETLASASMPAVTPVSTEPVVPASTVAGSSVSTPTDPMATNNMVSEAHAGMTPPPVETAESSVTDPGYAKTKSNHMVLIIVILVVVAFLGVLAMFFYRQYSNLMTPQSTISPTPVAQAVVSPTMTPSPTPVNEEEEELQSLEIDNVDTDLQTIDKDVTQL